MDVLLADLPNLSGSSGWLLVGMSVMAVLYLTVRPKKKDPLAGQPFRTSLAQQKALERDMQSVIVELSEMSRQMSAQVETRAVKLEALIREADAKIAELRDAAASAAESGHSGAHHLPISAPSSGRPAMRLAVEVDHHSEERWIEIYRLSDEGLSLGQIAQQLRRPTGEIELILALRPKRDDGQNIASAT